jgi:hypothetical protein
VRADEALVAEAPSAPFAAAPAVVGCKTVQTLQAALERTAG